MPNMGATDPIIPTIIPPFILAEATKQGYRFEEATTEVRMIRRDGSIALVIGPLP